MKKLGFSQDRINLVKNSLHSKIELTETIFSDTSTGSLAIIAILSILLIAAIIVIVIVKKKK